MSLRVVEIIVPVQELTALAQLLKGETMIGQWTSELHEDHAIMRILVPAERTEKVTDRVLQQFGALENFRLMLFAVEATLPQFEEVVEQIKENEAQQDLADAVLERVSREELYEDVVSGASLSAIYLITIILSTVVASVGLIRSNVAIIIGAMVIAPLLGPNVALALATILGDLDLGLRSLKALVVGVIVTFIVSLLTGYMIEIDPSTPEILSRTRVNVGDIVLALAAGSAGVLSVTTGIPSALIGVMVAVALLPPLVVTGLLTGAGDLQLALGAFILFITNIIGLNLAGVLTFLMQRVHPLGQGETRKAQKATRIAILLWVLLLLVLLFLVYSFS